MKESYQKRRKTKKERKPCFRLFGFDIDPNIVDQVKTKTKKRRRVLAAPIPVDHLPQIYRDCAVEKAGADETTITRIICKRLTETDMSRDHNRLSMPYKQTKVDFLTHQEVEFLGKSFLEGKRKLKNKIQVNVVDPSVCIRTMKFVKWNGGNEEKEKQKSKSCWWYALINGWNKFVRDNNLSEDDAIQVWSFRTIQGDNFGFIIHKIDDTNAGSSSRTDVADDHDRATKRNKKSVE